MREKYENSCRSETTFRRNFKRDYGERKGRNWESREDDNEFPREDRSRKISRLNDDTRRGHS